MDRAIVAVPSRTPAGLEAPRSQHFGRAEYFIVAQVEDGRIVNVRAVANQSSTNGGHGQMARTLMDEGLTDIITVGIGEGMRAKAQASGISIWIDRDAGTVGEAVAGFLAGSLGLVTDADVHAGHAH